MPAIKIEKLPEIQEIRIPIDCGEGLHIPYTLEDVGITQSLLGDFQTCRRSWLFSINRIEKAGAGRYMGYGSMVHECLDKMYTNISSGKIRYEDLIDLITVTLTEYDMGPVFSMEDAEMEKAKAQAVLECYIEVFKKDFTELRFEAVEESFIVKWNGWKLRGKKDGRFRDKNDGRWNMEHKNYSRISADVMSLSLTFDLQNLFYMLADMIEFSRLLSGVLYNILRNPEIRKKDGGPQDVYRMLKSEITKDPRHYFIRYELPYGMGDMNRFQAELYWKLQDIADIIKSDPKIQLERCYKNEHACTSPYRCDYLEACASNRLLGYVRSKCLFNELKIPKK